MQERAPWSPWCSGSILPDVSGSSWQWVVVAAIEVGAIVFLARRMFGSPSAPPRRRGPDVKASSLVRKKR